MIVEHSRRTCRDSLDISIHIESLYMPLKLQAIIAFYPCSRFQISYAVAAAASFACRSLSEAERCTWFFSLSVLNAFFLYIHMYTYVCIYSRHTNRYTYIYKYILLCIYTQIVRWLWILAVSQTLSKNFFSIFCSFFFSNSFLGVIYPTAPPTRPQMRKYNLDLFSIATHLSYNFFPTGKY